MAKKIDKNLKNERKLFLKEVKKAFDDPISYFDLYEQFDDAGEISTAYNSGRVIGFLKKISSLWLDSEVEGLVDEFPLVKERGSGRAGSAAHFNSQTNSIEIDLWRLSRVKNLQEIRNCLASYIILLCHEHQHFKQLEYVNAKESNDIERAKKLRETLGPLADDFAEDFRYDEDFILSFIKFAMPEEFDRLLDESNPLLKQVEKFKPEISGGAKTSLLKRKGFSKLMYYRSSIERDARETSLKDVGRIMKDFSKSGSFSAVARVLRSYLKSASSNITVLLTNSQKVYDKIKNAEKNINVDQIASLSKTTEEIGKKYQLDLKKFLFQSMHFAQSGYGFDFACPALLQEAINRLIQGKSDEEKQSLMQELSQKTEDGSLGQLMANILDNVVEDRKVFDFEQELESYSIDRVVEISDIVEEKAKSFGIEPKLLLNISCMDSGLSVPKLLVTMLNSRANENDDMAYCKELIERLPEGSFAWSMVKNNLKFLEEEQEEMLTEQNYENDTQESNETVVPSENQESLSEDKNQEQTQNKKRESKIIIFDDNQNVVNQDDSEIKKLAEELTEELTEE